MFAVIWNGKEVSVKTKKGYRTVNIEPALVQMLATHLEPAKAGRVLATRNDTPFRKSNVRRKLNQILKKLDLAPAEQAPCFSTCRVSVLQAKGARRLDCGMGRALKPADDIWVHAISRMNFADELC